MKIVQKFSIDENGLITDYLETPDNIVVTVEITHVNNFSEINVISTVTKLDLIKNEELKKFCEDYIYPILKVGGELTLTETEKCFEFHSIVTSLRVYGHYVSLLKEACAAYYSNKAE